MDVGVDFSAIAEIHGSDLGFRFWPEADVQCHRKIGQSNGCFTAESRLSPRLQLDQGVANVGRYGELG